MVFQGLQVAKISGGTPSILGIRPRLTVTRSKIQTRYCPKVGHSVISEKITKNNANAMVCVWFIYFKITYLN